MQTTGPGPVMIALDGVSKTFVMHLRGAAQLPVVHGVSFEVRAGECVALSGPSGSANIFFARAAVARPPSKQSCPRTAFAFTGTARGRLVVSAIRISPR